MVSAVQPNLTCQSSRMLQSMGVHHLSALHKCTISMGLVALVHPSWPVLASWDAIPIERSSSVG